MSWIKDAWAILESIVTLSRELERANAEIKELRRDVNSLTIAVSQIDTEVEHHKTTNQLVLDAYGSEIEHVKESIAGKFDVLLTKLDGRVAEFEHRFPALAGNADKRKSLKRTDDTVQTE